MIELLSEFLNMKNASVVMMIWGAIYIANSIAKATPNKTDNRAVKIIRKLMRTLGAEPPHPDVDEYDENGKAVSKDAKGK